VSHNSEIADITQAFEDVDLGKLEMSLRSPRTLLSVLLSGIAVGASLLACIPLLSILSMLVYRGGQRLSWEVLSTTPPAAFATGGGFGNAIVGTLAMVGVGVVLSVPAGILAAAYLALLGPDSWTSSSVRFAAKVLTGLPSVLAGVFAYAAVVLTTGGFSAPAGGVALAVLMLPTVLLTAESAIRAVPVRMKEAAIGMGATEAQLLWRIVLPTAMPGILTGVMLAVARAAGETAPLLFTALFSNYWILANGQVHAMRPTASLAVLIYNFSAMPFPNQIELAWAASLVLVAMVLSFNIAGQFLSRNRHRR
jgi:phosphate transport system permease protein